MPRIGGANDVVLGEARRTAGHRAGDWARGTHLAEIGTDMHRFPGSSGKLGQSVSVVRAEASALVAVPGRAIGGCAQGGARRLGSDQGQRCAAECTAGW